MPVDAGMKRAIVDKVVSEISACYIDPDVAGKIERLLREREGAGRYDRFGELTPFLQILRSDLYSVADDAHLGVWPIWYAPVPLDSSAQAQQEWREEQRRDHYGFRRVEVLPDNIGYLELTRFARPSVGEATARAAMGFLAGVDALIIDVRENHGGSEDMVNLICAYLFDEPVHTISFYTRYTGQTRDLWTPNDVRGSALAHIPVYVLQSGASASAAEHLSYALQAAGRARIVGERSRGAANPVEERVYPELVLNISLPVSRAIHPRTGTSWEGVGVKPDVATAAADALETALRLAVVRHRSSCFRRGRPLIRPPGGRRTLRPQHALPRQGDFGSPLYLVRTGLSGAEFDTLHLLDDGKVPLACFMIEAESDYGLSSRPLLTSDGRLCVNGMYEDWVHVVDTAIGRESRRFRWEHLPDAIPDTLIEHYRSETAVGQDMEVGARWLHEHVSVLGLAEGPSGEIWVVRRYPEDGLWPMDVFDRDGVYRGRLGVPCPYWTLKPFGDYIYGIGLNGQAPALIRYQLSRPVP